MISHFAHGHMMAPKAPSWSAPHPHFSAVHSYSIAPSVWPHSTICKCLLPPKGLHSRCSHHLGCSPPQLPIWLIPSPSYSFCQMSTSNEALPCPFSMLSPPSLPILCHAILVLFSKALIWPSDKLDNLTYSVCNWKVLEYILHKNRDFYVLIINASHTLN